MIPQFVEGALADLAAWVLGLLLIPLLLYTVVPAVCWISDCLENFLSILMLILINWCGVE